MNIPQTVFTVLYSIMWGAQAGAFGRWKMFDSGGFWAADKDQQNRTRRRLCWSAVCLNLAPVFYLVLALALLTNPSWDRDNAGHFWSQSIVILLTAVCAYYPLPGFYRFWVSRVQHNAARFYLMGLSEDEWRRQFPALPEDDLRAGQACGNFAFGCVYVGVSMLTGIASVWFVRCAVCR